MTFNFDSLKKSITKQPIAAGIGLLFLGWIIDNILFVRMPYKIITQTESKITDQDLENLETINLQKYKTNYARVFRFKEKYREFLRDCETNKKGNLDKWVTDDVCELFSIDNQNVEAACYNNKEDIFVIVLK